MYKRQEWYSCDEVKDDFELEHFNIDRDKTYTIPFILEALQRQKDFFVFGSPWSPPIWMKTKPAYNFGTIRMEDKILRAYAAYFVKFVEAYAKEGVPVRQVHVQNEPMADQKFPSCKWTGEDMRDFIKGYLGPAFEASGLDTEIWLGTINGPFMDILMGPNTPFSEFYDQWAVSYTHLDVYTRQDYANKYPLLFSSGEKCDLAYTATWLGFSNYASKGAFMNLDELWPTYAPNNYALQSETALTLSLIHI